MATYEIIITDVTCYGILYCVAGWDLERERMIRPEPPSTSASEVSKFWDSRFAGPGRIFSVGKVVRFQARQPPTDFLFPHATEDRIVDPGMDPRVVRELNIEQMIAAAAGSISETLEAAFNDGLVRASSGKAYVPSGYNGPSLGAVEVRADRIVFFEDAYQGGSPKLRARLTIDGTFYDLSVPADVARTRWKAEGLAGLRKDHQKSERVHLRVGLSRPFPAMPNQCYAQINGVYFL
jgi:hypothetical protein